VSGRQLAPDERAAALAAWSPGAAEAFREAAEGFGFYLDYTPGSLGEVERLITEKLSDRKGMPKKKWHDMAGATGAYLAEVILRNVGGSWGFNTEMDAGGIQLPGGTWIFPLHKSRKRYEDGPGDDLVACFAVVSEQAR